jgi:hypothetical protein
MANKRQELMDKFFNRETPVQVFPAEVLSVNTPTCTVRLLASGLEVEGVRLWADVDATDYLRLNPRVGSTVLVGCIENDLANLYVAQFAELDSFDVIIGDMVLGGDKTGVGASVKNTNVYIEANRATLEQDGTKVELQGGRVKITNGTVSLKDLFSDLATLLNTFIVITPSGPSTALGPTSITALTQLTAKINQLLS